MTSQSIQRNHLKEEAPPTQRNRCYAMSQSTSIRTRGLIRGGLLLLIAVYPICFMWQGLDFTDTGYYAVNCQQFFNAYPKDFGDAQSTAYWLTSFIGACWYELTGECGLIGFRVLYVLFNYCALGLVYVALRGLPFEKILLGVFAAEAYCIGNSFYIPSYNQVTSLFFGGSAVALYYGLVRRSRFLVFVGGLIAGTSVFARIVNFPIILLAAGVWYYHHLNSTASFQRLSASLRRSASEVATFVTGFASGIALVILLVTALGHLGAFRQMFDGLFGMAADPEGGYGPLRLLKAFIWDYFYTGVSGLGFVAIALVVGSVSARIHRPLARTIWIAICAGAVTFLLLKWPVLNVYSILAVVYVALLAAAFGMLGCNRELKLFCVLSGIVLFVTPLGSADGVCNSIYGMYLALAAALLAVTADGAAANQIHPQPPAGTLSDDLSLMSEWRRKLTTGARFWLSTKVDAGAIIWVCLLSVVSYSIVHRVGFTYRDSPDRTALHAAVNDPKLRGVFTTVSRARALEELLQNLKPLVRKDDYLLDHMQLPLLYFVTETRPYLFTSWANLYQPAAFEKAMARALSTRASLPVCVRTKIDTCHPKWPDETYPLLQSYRFVRNRRTIESFLQSHDYQKRWENSTFEVWTATPRK